MASLCKRGGDRSPGHELHFVDDTGRRRTIYLGVCYNEKTVNRLKEIVETLIYYRKNSIMVPDKKVQAWIESACPEIQDKLVKFGLIEIPESHTLKELWDTFLGQITGIEESTLAQYENKKQIFFEFFKESELLSKIGKERMIQWRSHLQQKYAKSTITGTLAKAKAVFNWAKTKGWIDASPLDGVSGGGYRNKKTEMFVPVDAYRRMLECCPDRNWAALLTLFRIAGLRPCEAMILKWENIDFEKSCFLVRSPKLGSGNMWDTGSERRQSNIPCTTERN